MHSAPPSDRVSDGLLGRLPALQSADYRRLFFNRFFASASNWALLLARGWLVFELTDSSFAVGLVTFAGMSPQLFIGPFAGAIADRADRRRMVVIGAWLGVATSILLTAITIGGVVVTWHVFVLAFFGGTARAIATPAEQALTANVVPREHLLNAVALSGISMHGSRVVGPLFGGLLLEFFGAGYVFLFSAVLMALAITQLSRIKYVSAQAEAQTPPPTLGKRASVLRVVDDVREGFRYVRGEPRMELILLLVMVHCGGTMAFAALMPRLATDIGGASGTFSAILVAVGAGAIVGTLTIALLRTERAQGYALALTGAGSGVAMVVLGLATTPAMAVLGAVLAGGAHAAYMALSATYVQQIVPDALRARVMSIYMMLAAGHMAFVNIGFGWLADIIGPRALLVAPGLVWMAVFVAGALVLPELRHLLARGVFRPRAFEATAAGD